MTLKKDSGIEWIGEIPHSWLVKPLYSVGDQAKTKNTAGNNANLLSLSYGEIKEKDIDATDGLLPESFDTYQEIKPGDLVFRFTDLQNDKRSLRSAVNRFDGIITSAYLAFRPKSIDSKYLGYLMRFYDTTKVFYSMGSGLRQSLKYSDVRRMPIIVPPIQDQSAIVNFLEAELSTTDRLITKELKLVETLGIRRQALITSAVTSGLGKDTNLRPTDLRWLSNIPLNWELKPLKYLVDLNKVALSEATPDDFSFNYIEISDVTKERGVQGWSEQLFGNAPSRARRLVKPGDVLVSTVRTYLRAVGKVPPEVSSMPFVASTGFAALSPKRIDPDFLKFALTAEHFVARVEANSTGISYPAINASDLVSFRIPVPPMEEQRVIAKHLGREMTKLDELVASVSRSIELLSERKSALIGAAVTGKIDVRGQN